MKFEIVSRYVARGITAYFSKHEYMPHHVYDSIVHDSVVKSRDPQEALNEP